MPTTGQVINNSKSTDEFDPHGPSREKFWTELSVEEKVERMRINVKGMQNELRQVQDDIETLFKHGHDKDGKFVIILGSEERYHLRQRYNSIQTGLLGKVAEDKTFF